MTDLVDIFAPILVFSFMAYLFYTFATKRGRLKMREMMLGGKIVQTVDEMSIGHGNSSGRKIRVHLIEKKHEPNVSIAIELEHKALLAWSVDSVTLDRSDAQRLVAMIETALRN